MSTGLSIAQLSSAPGLNSQIAASQSLTSSPLNSTHLSYSRLPLSGPHLDRAHRRAIGIVKSLRKQLPTTSEKELANVASLETIMDEFHKSLSRALEERKQLHSDALELANAESMDLYNSVLAAERRATVAEQNLIETQAKLDEQRKLISNKFADELSQLKHSWSDQLSATAKQNEMRSTLNKTRKLAEDQAARIKVMVEERARMIAEQTSLRRQLDEMSGKLNKSLTDFHNAKENGAQKLQHAELKFNTLVQHLESEVAQAQKHIVDIKKSRDDAERGRMEAEKSVSELKSMVEKLDDCQKSLAETKSKLMSSESLRADLESKEAALRSAIDEQIKTAKEEAVAKARDSLSASIGGAKAEVERKLSEEQDRLQSEKQKLKVQIADISSKLASTIREKDLLQKKCNDIETTRDRLCEDIEKLEKRFAEEHEKWNTEKQRADSLEERMHQELEKAAAIHSLNVSKAVAENQKQADKRFSTATEDIKKRTDELTKEVDNYRHIVDEKNRKLAIETASVESLKSKLNDSSSEIQENRQALLESLKMASEVQNSANEIRSQLQHEKEEHSRSKIEIENLRSQLGRARADYESAKKMHEDVELGRIRTREKREAAESYAHELESSLKIARGRVLELEDLRGKFEAEFRSLRGELEKEKSLLQREKENRLNNERRYESVTERHSIEISQYEKQVSEALHRCMENEKNQKEAEAELQQVKANFSLQESLTEEMKVKVALLQTEKEGLASEMQTQKLHGDGLLSRLQQVENHRLDSKREVSRIKADLENMKLKLSEAEDKAAAYMKQLQETKKEAMKENTNATKAEEALAQITKENIILRRRNMLMVNERERVRRDSEKLQAAARQAARKAQLAALHIQNMSAGQNSRADDAFSAAEDLNWVAIGGSSTQHSF